MTPIFRPECPEYLLPYLADREQPWDSEYAELLYVKGEHELQRKFRPRLVEDLLAVFGPYCCYCESYAHLGHGAIERYRPKSGRREGNYRHLQTDWRNLYWACPVCNRYKSNRFPLLGVAHPDMPYLFTVENESPVLLDPCRDDPDEHLRFEANGRVRPLSARGESTIELLDLNRPQLLQTRREQVVLLLRAGELGMRMNITENPAHRAVWRQLKAELDRGKSSFNFPAEALPQTEDEAPVEFQPYASKQVIDTESGEGLDTYLEKAQYVTRVRIKNFGPIHNLDLDLVPPEGSSAPCYALLGENGVGKSTVLRALAMALSGEAYTKALRCTSKKLLADDAYEGSVTVTLVGGDEVVMSFVRGKKITFSAKHSRSLVVAYGATRLLATSRHKAKQGRAHAKIDNLFDPFLPITNPTEWLRGLPAERLSDVNEVLRKLLPKEHQVQVVLAPDGGLSLEVGGMPGRQLHQLSDGYQCMLGMAVDIMQVLSRSGAALDSAEGIILIDELGNHFHPTWRLQCLPALREAFPGAQIIYSTHDPLCLRGLKDGEVAVLRRDNLNHIYALQNLPAVSKLRVEQLLTSEHFGLRSTVDPDLELTIKNYEELLAKAERTSEEEQLLTDAIAKLTETRYLGGSRRERLALQMLDTTDALDIPVTAAANVEKFNESTVSKLRFLMMQIAPLAEQQGVDNDQG